MGEIKACVDCGSGNLEVNDGEVICNDCGLLMDGTYRAAEGRNTGLSEPDNLPKESGNSFDGGWRIRVRNPTERSLFKALSELDRVSNFLKLPVETKVKAAKIYRKVVEKDLLMGRSVKGFIAASVYAACHMEGLPLGMARVSSAVGVRRKSANLGWRCIKRELGLEVKFIRAGDLVGTFAWKLGISSPVTERAEEIVRRGEKDLVVAGKSPAGVSAAALYLAGAELGEKRAQRELASAGGVTEATIRQRCRELEKCIGE